MSEHSFTSRDPRSNWDLPPWLWIGWQAPVMPLGIYRIQVGWGSVYIGSGLFMSRFKDHWAKLRVGKHTVPFQDAVNLVGPAMIRFDVLQCAPTGTPRVALEKAEYSMMDLHEEDGWTVLNVLRSPNPGSECRFRITGGGKWPWAKPRG